MVFCSTPFEANKIKDLILEGLKFGNSTNFVKKTKEKIAVLGSVNI